MGEGESFAAAGTVESTTQTAAVMIIDVMAIGCFYRFSGIDEVLGVIWQL